jgi:hypothetical protein
MGGLLGLVFGSARGKLDYILEQHNRDGWNLAEVVPDNPNLLIWILRLALLVVTLGLWTLSNGYLLILERPIDYTPLSSNSVSNGRLEPRLSSK